MLFRRVIFCWASFAVALTWAEPSSDTASRSRQRRYLAFPEGSVFSVVFCMTLLSRIPANTEIISEVLNWSLAYELPNDTLPLFEPNEAAARRRHRRELYGKAENVLNSMGYDGRRCMLRSVCEASRKLRPREDSLIYHILNVIFRFPQEAVGLDEPDDHRVYHWAAGVADDCARVFECPFSLIDAALGYYSSRGL